MSPEAGKTFRLLLTSKESKERTLMNLKNRSASALRSVHLFRAVLCLGHCEGDCHQHHLHAFPAGCMLPGK